MKILYLTIFLILSVTSAQAMNSKDVEKVHELLAQREDVQKNIDLLKAMKPQTSPRFNAYGALLIEVNDCAGMQDYIETNGVHMPSKCHTVIASIDEDDIKDIVAMMEKRKARIEKKITEYGVTP